MSLAPTPFPIIPREKKSFPQGLGIDQVFGGIVSPLWDSLIVMAEKASLASLGQSIKMNSRAQVCLAGLGQAGTFGE
jgi:hypothetical protein